MMSEKIIDIKGIMEKIPHRYPFLLVDRVVDYEREKWIKAIKNVTMNELFFQGHFRRNGPREIKKIFFRGRD